MTDLSGHSFGRYYLVQQLGEGGMAVVYKAHDTRLERDVAIKVIRREAFPPDALEGVLKRFEREAKSLARLSHPNIVKVHDFGEHENSPYLVMEYLPGGTLKNMLGKPMPWQEAARILLPISRGVSYAHQHGILHRDIKPANILITESGEPMLSDFGIAKMLEGENTTALTGMGMAIGTPEYMAPEQWRGITSPQSDMYSIGIMFYEMVTGRKPYTADTPAAILLKQANEKLPLPSQFAPDLPEVVEWLLIKTLAIDPDNRYPNMEAFIQALENLYTTIGSNDVTGVHAVKPAEDLPSRPEKADFESSILPDNAKTITDAVENQTESAMTTHSEPDYALENANSAQDDSQSKTVVQPRPDEVPAAVSLQAATPIRRAKKISPFKWVVPAAISFVFVIVLIVILPKINLFLNTPTFDAQIKPSTTGATPLPADVVDDKGFLMRQIPSGEFMMGSDSGDADEKPAHPVTVDGFFIDKYEVTNAQYKLCVDSGLCPPPTKNSSNTQNSYFGNAQFNNYPVIYVKWSMAKAFCEWRGSSTGVGASRLPTEAEWEKAARGTDSRIYPWGEKLDKTRANYFGNDTATVGIYESGKSPYGVYDMAGNVWEWVDGWYAAYPGGSQDASPDFGQKMRIVRGGSWQLTASSIRSTDRYKLEPDTSTADIGFRCARNLKP